jgi:hypothetical protein
LRIVAAVGGGQRILDCARVEVTGRPTVREHEPPTKIGNDDLHASRRHSGSLIALKDVYSASHRPRELEV